MRDSTTDAGERNQLRTGLSLAFFFVRVRCRKLFVLKHSYNWLLRGTGKDGLNMYEVNVAEYNEDMNMEIGQRIQAKRIERGLSGATLGAYLGISANQVSRIKTGKAKCSLNHFFVISQILNCSSDYLLFGKKQMPILSQGQVDMIEQLYQSITISRQW